MTTRRIFLAAMLLAPLLVARGAEEQTAVQQVEITGQADSEWGSYRRAYKCVAFFEKFTKSRPLIQAHLQIRPLDPATPMGGLHLKLLGKQTNIDIPVDDIGRATIPVIKQAFVEDAVLRLNRGKGLYYFSGRYSIKEREDGIYSATDLRSACGQLISAQRDSGYWMRLIGKKCVGVKFVYPDTASDISIEFKDAGNQSKTIPTTKGHPFEDNSMGQYQTAVYRFADFPEQGQVIANTRPIAIGTVYE